MLNHLFFDNSIVCKSPNTGRGISIFGISRHLFVVFDLRFEPIGKDTFRVSTPVVATSVGALNVLVKLLRVHGGCLGTRRR